jgi:hypothetical protein
MDDFNKWYESERTGSGDMTTWMGKA